MSDTDHQVEGRSGTPPERPTSPGKTTDCYTKGQRRIVRYGDFQVTLRFVDCKARRVRFSIDDVSPASDKAHVT